jgi:hypothetical protein
MMGAFSGDFDLGGVGGVRYIDLLGSTGTVLGAVAGYIEIDKKMFRVMTMTIPIIINDAFVQAALWQSNQVLVITSMSEATTCLVTLRRWTRSVLRSRSSKLLELSS